MPRPSVVLVIQHEDGCPPGLLEGWAERSGSTLDLRPCHRGARLPRTLSEHSGLIILGGEMGAYDDARFPWLTAAKSLVIQSVIQSVPFLGVCLGYQLAAVALGGRVSVSPHGPHRGVSIVRTRPEADSDPVFAALAPQAPVVQWNSDIVSSVPGGATVLAQDESGIVQALRFAERAWGVQGHPEATAEIVAGWGRQQPDLAAPGTASTQEVVAQIEAQEAVLERAWRPVADRFFEATKRPGPGPGGRAVVPLPPPPSSPHRGQIHHR